MEFCPKCGAVLMAKVKNSACPRCGYTQKGVVALKSSEKIEVATDIPIVKTNDSPNPIVKEKCHECGHGKCFTWVMQTRASDEPPTTFFKCVKCEHTRREYR
ncbi:MAG: transcription factor S [Nanoarchaeota archaeon]|nr:transcription factor S [Nanoarchaeota archaeon]